MTPGNLRLLSEQFLISGAITTLVDVILVVFLISRVKPLRFRQLKWILVGTAFVVWGVFAVILLGVFWDTYYRFFFPIWFRAGGILLFVPLLYGFFALAFHWLALRLPVNPIVAFCMLAGIESLLEHLWGIYGLKILEVPILQAASPLSILAFAFPEYVLYWCIVISIAALLQNGWSRWKSTRQTGMKAAQ
jgi:hypothetical protein